MARQSCNLSLLTIVASSRVVAVDVTLVNVVERTVGTSAAAAAAAAELGQGGAGVVWPAALIPAVPSGRFGSVNRGSVGPIGWARARGT